MTKKKNERSPLKKWENTMQIFKTRFPFLEFIAIGATCIFISAKMFGFIDWGWLSVFGWLIAYAIGKQFVNIFKMAYSLKMARLCAKDGKTTIEDFENITTSIDTFPFGKVFMGVLILLMIGGKVFGLIHLDWIYTCLPMFLFFINIIVWGIILTIFSVVLAGVFILGGKK